MAGSTTVLAVILVADIVAFCLAIAAEQSRPTARVETDARQEWTYCVYRPDAATGLGAAALALLLAGQAVAAVSSRCFCCGAALRPGGARACALILFVSSWLTFVIAESCLLAGLVQSAYHTRYRAVFFENPPDCESVRRGTFGAGAAFSLITCVLTGTYYFYFSKSRVSYARREATIGMSPYS
uniref:Fiber protein Fb34 n=1 Tax=Leersia perrieri TaxID=77586 RepID=A0A0D9XL27_9ORYZ